MIHRKNTIGGASSRLLSEFDDKSQGGISNYEMAMNYNRFDIDS